MGREMESELRGIIRCEVESVPGNNLRCEETGESRHTMQCEEGLESGNVIWCKEEVESKSDIRDEVKSGIQYEVKNGIQYEVKNGIQYEVRRRIRCDGGSEKMGRGRWGKRSFFAGIIIIFFVLFTFPVPGNGSGLFPPIPAEDGRIPASKSTLFRGEKAGSIFPPEGVHIPSANMGTIFHPEGVHIPSANADLYSAGKDGKVLITEEMPVNPDDDDRISAGNLGPDFTGKLDWAFIVDQVRAPGSGDEGMDSRGELHPVSDLEESPVSTGDDEPDTAPEEADSVEQVVYLNKGIVITAQRTGTQVFNRPEAVSSLNPQQLRFYDPQTTPDALAMMPGVFVQKTNLGGGSPFIRGLTGYHTLILVDGIRLNNSIFRSGPNQYLNTVDPGILRKIEVIRGGGATQYGSDAIGGTINLLTKQPEFHDDGFDAGLNLRGKYWSAGMERSGRIGVRAGDSWFGVLGGVSYKDFGDMLAGGGMGSLDPTGYSEVDADVKTRVRLSGQANITGAYQYTRQYDVPLYHKIVTGEYSLYSFDPQQRDLGYLKYDQRFDHTVLRSMQVAVSHQSGLEKRIKIKEGSDLEEVETDRIGTFGMDLQLNTQISKNWQAVSGVDFYSDRVNSAKVIADMETGGTEHVRGLYPDNSGFQTIGLFSLHSIEFESFLVHAGARYNSYRISLSDSVFGDLSIRPEALTGNLGLTWKLDENRRIVLTGNSGYRAPNINDVSSFGIADFRYEVPSYDLQPERSLNTELGYKQRSGDISFSLSGYYNRLFNLIINQRATYNGLDSLDGYQVYRKENVGKAYITGVEFAMEWLVSRQFLSYMDLTYTYGQNILDDEPLRRIPPINGRAGLKYFTTERLEFSGDLVFAGSQRRLSGGDIDDNRIPEGGTPGWVVMDLYGSYEWGIFRFSLSGQNLFNELYKTHGSGIYGVGRSFWVSVEVRI